MGKSKKKASKSIQFSPVKSPTKDVHFNNVDLNTKNHRDKDYLPPSGKGLKSSPSAGALMHMERQNIVLHLQPITTIQYCILEIFYLIYSGFKALLRYKLSVVLITLLIGGVSWVYSIPGNHQRYIIPLEKQIRWCVYWVGLGVLSSIGLGTGLHTFVIYLGPHIARVTLAAYECNSLDFPNYPDEVECPVSRTATFGAITLWAIVKKVRLESLMWGAGTALGELPPYFVARGARLSGESPDDEDYKEFLALQQKEDVKSEVSFWDRGKLMVEGIVKKTGFLGILLFASIPNPLFDFAGITCGHFLIPFWSFFGATLIGKAVVKMHIQMLFVILAFSQHYVESIIEQIGKIPRIGLVLQSPLAEFFNKQKEQFHRHPGTAVEQKVAWFQVLINLVVTGMILGFLVSILNSLAQRYHKRCCDARKKLQ